ncbi:hypothetical protein UCDDS831_g08504 [Diplodia seriata]|uniref:Uncharacterized protein n=1 Tax=Diplodia seriata TaxID=420778 RepID=A0A0G2DTQ5_9PEZI|nr:hypothetical protein UCDDS831_g08504 [Diplodia seriata]
MPRMTLRKWLDQPNPEFNVDPRIRASTHQTENDRIHMKGWRPWKGFNLQQINTLFGHILDAEYNFPDLKPIEKAHLVVANEPTLEFAVSHWNLEIVNTALRVVTRNGPHLLWSCGASAKFPSEKRPDWSAVRNDTSNIDRPSYITGDTKMLGPRFPAWAQTQTNAEGDWERHPLRTQAECLLQVLGYAAEANTRYAYLLGPYELIVIRAGASLDSNVPNADSIAASRPKRQQSRPDPNYGRNTSSPPPSSPPSLYPSSLPVTPRVQPCNDSATPASARRLPYLPSTPIAGSGSRYADSSPGKRALNMHDPLIKVVKWQSPTDGLTANMTMFVVHYSAGVEWEWKDDYPEFSKDPALRAALGLPKP